MTIDLLISVFFFNDTATTEIYTLSLHDALPIYRGHAEVTIHRRLRHHLQTDLFEDDGEGDRKSTRLNSSHQIISYAVFCLKKKKSLNLLCQFSSFVPSASIALRPSLKSTMTGLA